MAFRLAVLVNLRAGVVDELHDLTLEFLPVVLNPLKLLLGLLILDDLLPANTELLVNGLEKLRILPKQSLLKL